MSSLRIECITTQPELERLETEWRALEPRILPVPFTSYDWNIAWWKHMHSARKAVCDSLFVITLRDTENQLRGVAPLMITHRPAVGPLRLAQLQFFGADQNITEMRGLAAPVEDAPWLYAELIEYLRTQKQWDWMKLTGLPAATLAKEVVEKI